jgi:uncharacterized protein
MGFDRIALECLRAIRGKFSAGLDFYVDPHCFRIVGSGWVVPPLEEVFYRSFVYRYIIKPNFQEIPLNHFNLRAFVITVLVFAAAHPAQWLAAILCGAIYQWLVIRKNRLGDAMTAHAITNILLGIYVAWKGQWQFW